jgi:hypothetical protein
MKIKSSFFGQLIVVAAALVMLMGSAFPANYGNSILIGFDETNGFTDPVTYLKPLPVVTTPPLAINAISGVARVVSATPGAILQINVITASGVGAVYDSSTTASGVAATQVFAIPATVGIYQLNWPMTRGIVVNPSSSVVSVSYR